MWNRNALKEYTDFLNKKVEVEIDRPLGSLHPKYKFKYEVNYGFIPNTKAPDKEEIDAYVLGVDEPLKNFRGICVAVIHRLNDNDDKLIVTPFDYKITNKEITDLTHFQEKYFEIEIIRSTL